MPFPWSVKVAFSTDVFPEYREHELQAYCLADLVKDIQGNLRYMEEATYLIHLPTGETPLDVDKWLELLTRNYVDGLLDEPFTDCTFKVIGDTIHVKLIRAD